MGTGGSEKERGRVPPSHVAKGGTTAQRMPLKKPLPILGLGDHICAMGLGHNLYKAPTAVRVLVFPPSRAQEASEIKWEDFLEGTPAEGLVCSGGSLGRGRVLARMQMGTERRLEKRVCLLAPLLGLPHFLGGQAKSLWSDVKKAAGPFPGPGEGHMQARGSIPLQAEP